MCPRLCRQHDQAHASDARASNHHLLKLVCAKCRHSQCRQREVVPNAWHLGLGCHEERWVHPLVKREAASGSVVRVWCRRPGVGPMGSMARASDRGARVCAQQVAHCQPRQFDKSQGLERVWRYMPAISAASRIAAKAALDPVPNGVSLPVEPVRIVGGRQAGAGRRRGRHPNRRGRWTVWRVPVRRLLPVLHQRVAPAATLAQGDHADGRQRADAARGRWRSLPWLARVLELSATVATTRASVGPAACP